MADLRAVIQGLILDNPGGCIIELPHADKVDAYVPLHEDPPQETLPRYRVLRDGSWWRIVGPATKDQR